jgi:hypothetical protein
LCLSLAVAATLTGRGPRRPGHFKASLLIGAAVLAAGVILTLKDPGSVASMMPVLGAGAAFPIWSRCQP